MALKQFRPITPGTRQLVLVDKSDLYKGKPLKKLVEGQSKSGGRNNTGRVTSWQKGGGHKQSYRLIDFKRRKFDVVGTVERIEYDPNRTAFIALINYEDGEQAYILAAPRRRRQGDRRRKGRREAGQRDAAARDAGRHDRAQRRAASGQGRPVGAFGRHVCTAGRSRQRLRSVEVDFG
jgi:ribosomal protein L2